MCHLAFEDWRNLNFVQVAQRLLKLFIDDVEHDDLDALTAEAFASFDVPEVVAWKQLDQLHVLELFHGPTLAFKDVALQLLGKLFEHVLADRRESLNILGATSGDTGSAAIAGVAGMENIKIFILYQKGRISSLQELQMTTVPDTNVQCISVNGTFDDCQRIMKSIFLIWISRRPTALALLTQLIGLECWPKLFTMRMLACKKKIRR